MEEDTTRAKDKLIKLVSDGISGQEKCWFRKGRMLKVKGLSPSKSQLSHSHDVSIGTTSTFGELKMVLSLVTGFEPREQRLLYRGKEREDREHLHMVGVVERDKVLLLEDPAIKERKLRSFMKTDPLGTTHPTISV